VETANNISPGDLVRYGPGRNSLVGIVVRAVSSDDDAWQMQTFGVDASWVIFFDSPRAGWVYDKELEIISPINKRG